ncbi:TerB family tellurite resistance protein [Alphaproteobacteria bacterium]|nr:TerB family tellurite resistance protein [Alphaproteobacteria bacterium]
MFKDLKNFFSKKETPETTDNSTNIAVLRIIYEIIAADHVIKDEEIAITVELLKKYFDYDENQTSIDLFKLKEENFFNTDLTKITYRLKNALAYNERINIIKVCWHVLLIDNNEDVLETATVRKISILLGIEDKDFISIRNDIREI